MNRAFHVACREFLATVATKGFVIGLLITPALLLLAVALVPRLAALRAAPAIEGEIAIVDPTDAVTTSLRAYLDPTAIAARRGELVERVLSAAELPDGVRQLAEAGTRGVGAEAMETALGSVPGLRIATLRDDADVETEKATLIPEVDDGGRLALVVVHHNAVEPADDGPAGTYDLFIRRGLDERVVSEIRNGLRSAIVDARARSANLDRSTVEALTRVRAPSPVTVTADTERSGDRVLDRVLPVVFMVLLMVSLMMGGQSLLTSTVEEKSSRVVEVLLAAVSPLELMTGKILGQMAVGFVVLGFYIVFAIAVLASFALFGLVNLWLIVYLLSFYLITYLIIGSLMAAVGSAVNELREAQALMTPFVLILTAPWMFWWYVSANPDATFSVVLSFVPPLNGFVILVRLASHAPPPLWQVLLSIVVGVAAVFGALWVAAKVFRIGLLMHGKPPNLATLFRWVRMA